MPKSSSPLVLLVDNGSLEPAATLALRTLAKRVAAAANIAVRPVSLLHSSALAPELLDGQSAEILEPTLRMLAGEKAWEIVILPLFIGPSGAMVNYLPERVSHLRQTWPLLKVRVAPCLVNTTQTHDTRLATMLTDRVRATAQENNFSRPAIAVVDHGTPERAVNAVRELITVQMRTFLGDSVRAVTACSMERRPGPEYAFNEPLLEHLLDTPEFSRGEVIIARLFLQPGRHAGPGGDLEQIAWSATSHHSSLKIAFTEPLGSHPDLVPLLVERLTQGQNSTPL